MAKVQLGKDAGDGHENGDQSNTVEMDVEEPEDQDQDMSSEDESGNCEAVIKSKVFDSLLYPNGVKPFRNLLESY